MKEEKKPSIFVTTVGENVKEKLQSDLVSQGFELSKPAYTVFSARKKGVSCTLYESGKLTVQGKEMESFIEFYLEPEILKAFQFTYQDLSIDTHAHIGVDETGKGDFFGPLCIAAVFAEGDAILKLKSLGVRDSKHLSDAKAIEIGKKIESQYAHHIVKINPLKYNELYQKFKNLNRLLAWGHATAIRKLYEKTDCPHILIDQFADPSLVKNALGDTYSLLKVTQRHRAEEDLVVAAASIIARKTFLEGLKALSEELGKVLPKGAGSPVIQTGKELLKEIGEASLANYAKMHFKTVQTIKGI